MFSKACEYAIKASIYVAVQSRKGRRVSLKEIAKETGSPEAFTAKILQQLARHHILKSEKGAAGGFSVEQECLGTIRLAHIVAAVDGNSVFTGCGLGLERCDEKYPCPVHDKFKSVRDDLRDMMENTALLELATALENGRTWLKRQH